MSTIFIAYGTGEGQTAKVADYVATELAARGHEVTTRDLGEPGDVPAVDAFDAVVVGASIHMGAHQDVVVDFAREWRDGLATRPSAFFQVSLSSASTDPEQQADAARYVDEFRETTGWNPDVVGGFAGAIRYSEYGFLKRFMMKRIAKDATGDTDASKDYEYTDWEDVASFVHAVDALVDRDAVAESDRRVEGPRS
ncbi:flavodoxin domain-containing protein [Halorubellus salinus]|uniref:flavodoxin domain-containing protein n=1 Tax=Halorubellus salinus TaxID=755309 RepID=UPI001D07492E|nr:flavodoxin domain-containing protein [Halorubellus salinus]